jgi:hypothetical protein
MAAATTAGQLAELLSRGVQLNAKQAASALDKLTQQLGCQQLASCTAVDVSLLVKAT